MARAREVRGRERSRKQFTTRRLPSSASPPPTNNQQPPTSSPPASGLPPPASPSPPPDPREVNQVQVRQQGRGIRTHDQFVLHVHLLVAVVVIRVVDRRWLEQRVRIGPHTQRIHHVDRRIARRNSPESPMALPQ